MYSLDSDQGATVQGIYVDSLKLCWQVGLAFSLLGFLIALVAKDVPMRTELETEFGMMQGIEKSPKDGTGSEARGEKRNSVLLQERHAIDAN